MLSEIQSANRNVNSTVKLFNNLHFTWSIVQNSMKNTKWSPFIPFVCILKFSFVKPFMIYAMNLEKCVFWSHCCIAISALPAQRTASVHKSQKKSCNRTHTQPNNFISLEQCYGIMGMGNGKPMCKIIMFKRSYQIVGQMQ